MDISELNKIQSVKNFKRHPWEITRAKVIHFLLKKNASHFNHITDVGSGDAFVLQKLAQNNIASAYTATDTAYNEQLIQYLRGQPNAAIINFKTDLHQAPLEKSDCILLSDVLEHCENDKEVLNSLIDPGIITNNALFFITVPAFQNLFSQHDHLLKHYRRYSRKKINQVCLSQRLLIVSSGYFFFTLLPARFFQLLLEKTRIRKVKKSIANWKGGNLITRIISSILWADFRVCYALSKAGIYLPGLSCYCICRKLPS